MAAGVIRPSQLAEKGETQRSDMVGAGSPLSGDFVAAKSW